MSFSSIGESKKVSQFLNLGIGIIEYFLRFSVLLRKINSNDGARDENDS